MKERKTETIDRQQIIRMGVRNALLLVSLSGAAMFVSAGSLAWRQAWILLGLFLGYFAVWIAWGLRNNPELLMERARSLRHEAPRWDRAIVGIYTMFSLVLYIVAGIDYGRASWSQVPELWENAAFVLVLLGYLMPLWALTNNPFASGIVRIQKERGHTVSSDGPYRFVRHPMYVGTLFFSLGAPIFLGSWWALLPGLGMAALFVLRTALEDRTLQTELKGYADYAQRVRYRLVPGVW